MWGPPCWSLTSWPWNAGTASTRPRPAGPGVPPGLLPPAAAGASTPSASRGPGAIFNSAELLVLKVDGAPGQGSGGGGRGRGGEGGEGSRESLTAAFLPPAPPRGQAFCGGRVLLNLRGETAFHPANKMSTEATQTRIQSDTCPGCRLKHMSAYVCTHARPGDLLGNIAEAQRLRAHTQIHADIHALDSTRT